MYRRIIIPLDGSPVAEQVLPLAKMLIIRFQSSVLLMQAIQPIGKRGEVEGAAFAVGDQFELLRTRALEYLKAIEGGFPRGVSVQHEIRIGLPAAAILESAETAHVDLIAMATHGRSGIQRWVYGSVADKVLSGARLPILLVRASQVPSTHSPIRRILVPVDGSTLAERALIPARHLAKAFDAEILLFRVQEPSIYVQAGLTAGMSTPALDEALCETVEEYLTDKTWELRNQGIRVGWETQFGMAAENILEAAQKRAANLVVMSTHGRSGAGRWIMGSVADRVLRSSRIPVLLIRSGAVVE
jgi:nucleotide-binding universal stress UspA family protein